MNLTENWESHFAVLLLFTIHQELDDSMSSSSNKNTQYEKFVRDIVEALVRAQGLETVDVQHDVQVRGISRSHQIDVYWEYRLGGILHRVIINCKRYAHSVEVTDVLALSGVITDMPGVRGLIVTTLGYQKGAIEYAKTHSIGLKIIRPPEDHDWEGRIQAFRVQVHPRIPELHSCNIQINREWVKEHVGDPALVSGTSEGDSRSMIVRDLLTGAACDMNALWNRAMRENPTAVGTEGRGVLRWSDARLEQPGKPPLRVDAIEFRWLIRAGEPITMDVRSAPQAIVCDAIAGTLLFVDPDGTVTGDVEEEFGTKA